MTSEQIAELRAVALRLPEVHYPPLATMGEREAFWVRAPEYEKVKALLPRLLGERDWLLKAAKEAAEGFDIVAADDIRLLALLREAITKAEAP